MSKKTVVITGSSRGIGRACAILFAKNNYNVVINYNKFEASFHSLLLDSVDEVDGGDYKFSRARYSINRWSP